MQVWPVYQFDHEKKASEDDIGGVNGGNARPRAFFLKYSHLEHSEEEILYFVPALKLKLSSSSKISNKGLSSDEKDSASNLIMSTLSIDHSLSQISKEK